MADRLSLSKVCDLPDFEHPDLRPLLRRIFAADLGRFGPRFPEGHEYRKQWEIAMAIRSFEETGVLGEQAEVLGVAAGVEPTIFWLSTRARRVFATDRYLDPGDWGTSTATSGMLVDPGRYWPGLWNPRRVVVQHMDALDLRYEDDCFDAAFSASSIEHLGDPGDIARAIREIHRVLKPGGVLAVSTELRVNGPAKMIPGAFIFDADVLGDVVIGAADWELVGDFDTHVSPATLASAQSLEAAVHHSLAQAEQHGAYAYHELEWEQYPHIVLSHEDVLFTSVHLTLRKPVHGGES